jgi:methionyl aminopeptidase
MKADLKKDKEIAIMLDGGKKLGQIRDQLEKFTQPGISLLQIEEKAQALIKKTGGKAGFATVPGYNWATCTNLNEGIVHGIPTDRVVQVGDLVSIDIGLLYKGFHTDTCTSFLAKNGQEIKNQKQINHFLQVGKQALNAAIKQVKPGRRVGHISQAIQTTIEDNGYACSYELTGHGVGRQLHEYPPIPCILNTDLDKTPMLKPGMTLAIEVIYAMGKPDTYTDKNDGWTIKMTDGNISAVFEKTIAITKDDYLIVTP